MSTVLTDVFQRHRGRYSDLEPAIWLAWEGFGYHRVRLLSAPPDAEPVIAKGEARTFPPNTAVTVGRYSGDDTRGWVLLAGPAPQTAGALIPIASALESPIIDIVAVFPEAIEVYVPTAVLVIGLGFVESPLTTFAAWDPVASDPATATWVVDPNVTLASPLWVANPSPGAAYAAFPLLTIQLTITATVALAKISLRITS